MARRPEHRGRRLTLAVLLLVAMLVAALLVLVQAWRLLNQAHPIPSSAGQEAVFIIERGDSLRRVLKRFDDDYGLPQRHLLRLYARLFDRAHIRHGEYLLPERASALQLLALFSSGKVRQHSVTLVEGVTAAEALGLLRAHPALARTLAAEGEAVDTAAVAARLGIDNGQLEGWLFPDTYYFERGSSDWALVQRAHQRMRDILAAEWQARAVGLPYDTAYEALVMASIVEKETGAAHEREQIAGVFVRRLQRNMRLQTDPTVIYGLGSAYQGDLTRAHLRQPTPYNTYVIRGLPPTPIALPGREAIRAALQPAAGSSLYFVARGDGTHEFSETLEQHQRAVRHYQLNRVPGYRSSVR